MSDLELGNPTGNTADNTTSLIAMPANLGTDRLEDFAGPFILDVKPDTTLINDQFRPGVNNFTGISGRGVGFGNGVNGLSTAGAGVNGASGSGVGVNGTSTTGNGVNGVGVIGVVGTSGTTGFAAVAGSHTGTGYGVVGDGAGPATAGVVGRHPSSDGVVGTGGLNGVKGTGPTGVSGIGTTIGVSGTGPTGVSGIGDSASVAAGTPGGMGVVAVGGRGDQVRGFPRPHLPAGAGLLATGGAGKLAESIGGAGVIAVGGAWGGDGVQATGQLGVDAIGTGGPGVRGTSKTDRGGVFRSTVVAQLHLEPIFFLPTNPMLSTNALAGDIVAISEPEKFPFGPAIAGLWFCTLSGTPATSTAAGAPGTWKQIA